MANAIKLKKGLDIPVEGHAEARIVDARACEYYALVPDDFHGIVPKVLVKPGDKVKIGSPLMCDKNNPVLQFVSPVSGEVAGFRAGDRFPYGRTDQGNDAFLWFVYVCQAASL